MTISTNTTDRKAMAKAMAEHLGTTAKYMGVPSCGYQVGDYIVDKEGNIHGDDFEGISCRRSDASRRRKLPRRRSRRNRNPKRPERWIR